MNSKINKHRIIEKELDIPGDYQFIAINSSNFLQSNWHRSKFFVLQKMIHFNRKMNVLDLGTGSGNFEILFHSFVKKITGVDHHDQALIFLKKYLRAHKISNVELVLTDILTYKTKSKFDLIAIVDTIEHLNKSEINRLPSKFRRLLLENGKVCIITPNYRSLWPLFEIILDKFSKVPKLRSAQHLFKFDQASLTKIFNDKGFVLERSCTFNHFSFFLPDKQISKIFCNLENSLSLPFGPMLCCVFSLKK